MLPLFRRYLLSHPTHAQKMILNFPHRVPLPLLSSSRTFLAGCLPFCTHRPLDSCPALFGHARSPQHSGPFALSIQHAQQLFKQGSATKHLHMREQGCSLAQGHVGLAAGRGEHAGGGAVGDEVAHILALWPVIVVLVEADRLRVVVGGHDLGFALQEMRGRVLRFCVVAECWIFCMPRSTSQPRTASAPSIGPV